MLRNLIITFLLITSAFYTTLAQTINTNYIYMTEDDKTLSTEFEASNIFEFYGTLIVWTNDENTQTYFVVESINRKSPADNIYFINCNTLGKKVSFTVDFDKSTINTSTGLFFSKNPMIRKYR